ncbi:MAG: WYL domain-containing protein, partial [Pseudomonadota bacterium]|nr:WYL domain-containing protein [Pseudomonadota bacterium]
APTNRQARWADKIRTVSPALSMVQAHMDAEVLETVQQALLEEHQLDVIYRKLAGRESHSLRLHPLGMVQRGSTTYLVATAFEYDDVRLYAVQRIVCAAALDEAVKYPAGFSLDDYIADGSMQFGSRKEIRLRARLSDDLAAILAETPLAEDQKLTCKADSHYVHATVIDSWQLHWWIMSQGPGIEVLKPVRLRRDIEASLSKALAAYRSAD